MYLTTSAAYDREPAVLGLEPPKRVDQNVQPSRIHERDLGQIYDDRTGLMLENRQQKLTQHGRGLGVDFPVDTEHRYVLVWRVGR